MHPWFDGGGGLSFSVGGGLRVVAGVFRRVYDDTGSAIGQGDKCRIEVVIGKVEQDERITVLDTPYFGQGSVKGPGTGANGKRQDGSSPP